MLGPFYATENDATIMKLLYDSNDDDNYFNDRGVRDLELLNYKVQMPLEENAHTFYNII